MQLQLARRIARLPQPPAVLLERTFINYLLLHRGSGLRLRLSHRRWRLVGRAEKDTPFVVRSTEEDAALTLTCLWRNVTDVYNNITDEKQNFSEQHAGEPASSAGRQGWVDALSA